jgi:hypothetical protein
MSISGLVGIDSDCSPPNLQLAHSAVGGVGFGAGKVFISFFVGYNSLNV